MSVEAGHLQIPAWANGPDDSGNGGWSAGMLAQRVPNSRAGLIVNLRIPPPLERPLQVEHDHGADAFQLMDHSGTEPVMVADAALGDITVEVPRAVCAIRPEAAEGASAGFAFRDEHPFPRCVACGTARSAGEVALRLHCGPIAGVFAPDAGGEPAQVFADAWIPESGVADADDPSVASVAACWSALDCPSATPFAAAASPDASVLARIGVRLDQQARIGEPHVLAAWQWAVDGRKQRSVSALLDAHGKVLGVAEALWIQVRPR